LRKSPPSAEAWSIGRSDTYVPPLVVADTEPPPEAQRLIIRRSSPDCQYNSYSEIYFTPT
jgi:hypothetical protein